MKKRFIYAFCAMLVGCSMLLPASAAKSTISDAKDKKEELKSQLGDVESQVEELKEKSASTQEYIEKLDAQLSNLSAQLIEIEQELETKETELIQTQAELDTAKATKDKQYEDMKKRIKFMYESGNSAYLEMILEADDFTDMLNKADYVKQISEYDRSMLTEFQSTVEDIAAKEVQIEKEVTEIEQMKADVEQQKKSVEALADTKQSEMDSYQKEIAKSEALQQQYQDELEEQEALIASLEAEAARKAAEEAKKKAEEEAKKAAEAAKKAEESKKSDSSSVSADNKTDSASSGTASSGTTSSSGWTWPIPGYSRVSSDYGYRTHPITGEKQKMHYGIDFPAPSGTPIVAAKAGTVLAAGYSSSMGNYVIIDHGGGISSVYMHCSAFATSSGAKVSAGQRIAYVGNTGASAGNHLHFSVRVNGSYVNPWNYISK